MKLKLGDYVHITAGKSRSSKIYEGRIGKVIRLGPQGVVVSLDIDIDNSGFWRDELSLVCITDDDWEGYDF